MTGASIAYYLLRADPALRPVRAKLTQHFGRIAAERLSATTAFTADAMSAAIARERRLARHLSIVITVMAIFVVLSNSRPDMARGLAALELSEVAFTSLFYFVFVSLLGALFRWLIRALGERPEALGLQLHDWRRQIAVGLWWSLPGLAVAAALRAWFFPGEFVLSVHAFNAGSALLSPVAIALLLAYVLVLCPVQEYVTRAGVQAPILNAFGASRERLGRQVKILINTDLLRIPEMQGFALPIDFAETREALRINAASGREAVARLEAGETIAMFPSGGVATARWPFGPAGDLAWKTFAAKLVHKARADVAPLYFVGQNSWLFQAASQVSLFLRLSMLVPEALRRVGRNLEVHTGPPIPYEEMAAITDRRELADMLRQRIFTLAPAGAPRDRVGRLRGAWAIRSQPD